MNNIKDFFWYWDVYKLKENYTVYIHKCLENGRAYVGVIFLLPEKRWENG